MAQEEVDAGIRVNLEGEIRRARAAMSGIDLEADDANWGISVYMNAVLCLAVAYPSDAAST